MTIDEKIKRLVTSAQKLGYVTFDEFNETFSDSLFSGEELDEIYIKLRRLEVEVIEQAPD